VRVIGVDRARKILQAVALTGLALSFAAMGRPPAVRADPPPPIVVVPGDNRGNDIGISVTQPGHPGHRGVTTKTALGGCDAVCKANARSHSLFCSQLAQGPIPAATWAAYLKTVRCAAGNQAAGRPPTAAELATAAYGQLRLPAPVPARYPSGTLRDGRPYTIVQTHMWFWSAPSVWKPLSKTVCAGALCATATARPSSLSFDPGNGDQPVSCDGPGTSWVRPAGGSWVPVRQPQGCDYQYTRSTYGYPAGELTATYTITWGVTWTGTNGRSGTLNPLATRVNSTFAVAELQSVVSR
jgi:hypothetical protein